MKYLALLALVIATPCLAIEDTPANREKEADHYLAVSSPGEMMNEMVMAAAKRMPDGQKEKFIEMMTKNFDVAALTKAMKENLVKVFTADELKALADFHGSALGKSATKKMGTYMTDMMPAIQSEMKKAWEKTQAAAAPAAPATTTP